MKKILRKTLITLLIIAILLATCQFNISNADYGIAIEEYASIEEYMKGYYYYGDGWDYEKAMNRESITLQHADIKDYSGLTECPNLESLDIFNMRGGNITFPHLPNLKELEISYTTFTSIDLTNLTGLEKLTISDLTLEKNTIELKNMTKLKELNIYTWNDLSVKLVNTNNITYLETDSDVNIETQNCNFNNLEKVMIRGSYNTSVNWEMFAAARTVEIQGAYLSQEIIDIFSNAEKMNLYGGFWDGTLSFKNPKLEELICEMTWLDESMKIDITPALNLKKFACFLFDSGATVEVEDKSEYIISNMDDVIEISEVGRYVYIGRKNEELKTVTLEQYITENYPNQAKENITALEIKNTNIKDLRNLKQLPNLKKITLKNMNLNSIDFKDLENLEELYIKDSTLDGVLYLSNNENLNHLEIYLRGDLSNSIIYLNELELDYVNFTYNKYETSNFNRLKTLKSNLDFEFYSNFDDETGEFSYIHKPVGGYGGPITIYEFLQDTNVNEDYLNGKFFLCGFTLNEENLRVGNIKNAFNDEVEVNVYNVNDQLITDNNVVAYTGMKVEVIKKGDLYDGDYLIWSDGQIIDITEIVIYGDVNGDGQISSVDALQIIKNKNQKLLIENEANYLAGRVTENSRRQSKEPSAVDALAIIKHLNGKYKIKQNIYYY